MIFNAESSCNGVLFRVTLSPSPLKATNTNHTMTAKQAAALLIAKQKAIVTAKKIILPKRVTVNPPNNSGSRHFVNFFQEIRTLRDEGFSQTAIVDMFFSLGCEEGSPARIRQPWGSKSSPMYHHYTRLTLSNYMSQFCSQYGM